MQALIYNKKTTDWDKSRGFELADVPKPEIQKDEIII